LADLSADYGLSLADMRLNPPQDLIELYGDRVDNPLDLGNMVLTKRTYSPPIVRQLLEGLDKHSAVDAILFGFSTMPNIEDNMVEVGEYVTGGGKPVVVYDGAGSAGEKGLSILRKYNLFPIQGAELSVRAIRSLIGYASFQTEKKDEEILSHKIPDDFPTTPPQIEGLLNEVESKAVLDSFGLPICK
jgi:hypothetical protein